MKVVIDCMGGDNAPGEIVKGSILAVSELDIEVVLVGDEKMILKVIEDEKLSMESVSIVNAPLAITMCDDPMSVIKDKKDSSLSTAFNILKDKKADALVAASNTGALLVGATMIVKRIKNVKRAALAPILPTANGPCMLIDGGANTECKPEYLEQFGLMGSLYMEKILNIKSPKVGLVNIGAEESKGIPLYIDTHKIMKDSDYNFIGNVEGRDIPYGVCDVVVADGFTGNIILKLFEGLGKYFSNTLKGMFKKNFVAMLGALCVKSGINEFKKKMDYKEHGGAPLMGVSMPVIKAHGSSDAKAIKNAIKQAVLYSERNVIKIIEEKVI